MSARDELADMVIEASWRTSEQVADAILAAGYRKPGVIVEWGAAHAANGVVYDVYRTRGEAQAFVDSMAAVGHPMIIKRREYTPATHTAWEPLA